MVETTTPTHDNTNTPLHPIFENPKRPQNITECVYPGSLDKTEQNALAQNVTGDSKIQAIKQVTNFTDGLSG